MPFPLLSSHVHVYAGIELQLNVQGFKCEYLLALRLNGITSCVNRNRYQEKHTGTKEVKKGEEQEKRHSEMKEDIDHLCSG